MGSGQSEAKTYFKGTFAQRKKVNVHLFENRDQWHLFWFLFNDAYSGPQKKATHWQGGDHLHHTSHLWGNEKEVLWDALKNRDYSIRGIHVRYNHEAE
ncbi:MAG: hypothetical protein EBQ92_01070 [Proteobacteria bacterium]|nr:hypothetical protein [Pseudomonadota bacterium]